jgi:hypothetical protein
MNALYDICGLRIRATGLADAAIPDINTKLHWFETPDDGRPADVELAIGDFQPDRAGCLALDRRYWARPGRLYLEESDKGLSWRAEITGLDRDPGETLRIRFAHGPKNHRRIPWRLFPDLIAHLYVLWPVLECELAARGLYLVHAGGVEREGRALVIAGRGGVNKTAMVADLVRRGWRPMGDDFVLLQRTPAGTTRVRALPTSPRWFEFQLRHMRDEDLSLIDKLRLLRFLYHKRGVGVEFSREADLGRLVLVDQVEGCTSPAAAPVAHVTAAEMLHLNCRMERTSYVGYGTIIGRFLEAYSYVVPESAYGREWDGLSDALAGLVTGVPARRIVTPARYDPGVTDLVESE